MSRRAKNPAPVDAPRIPGPRTRRQTRSFTGPLSHQPLNSYADGRGCLLPLRSPSTSSDEAVPPSSDEACPADPSVAPTAAAPCGAVTRAAARRHAAALQDAPGVLIRDDATPAPQVGATRTPPVRASGRHPPTRGKGKTVAAAPAAAPTAASPILGRSSTRRKGKVTAEPADHARTTAIVDPSSWWEKDKKALLPSPPARSNGPVTRSVTRRGAGSSAIGAAVSSSAVGSRAFTKLAIGGAVVPAGHSTLPRGPGVGGRTPRALRDFAGAAGANFMAQWTPSSSPSPAPVELERRRGESRRDFRLQARTTNALPVQPPLSTDPDSWSPPPTRGVRRLAE